ILFLARAQPTVRSPGAGLDRNPGGDLAAPARRRDPARPVTCVLQQQTRPILGGTLLTRGTASPTVALASAGRRRRRDEPSTIASSGQEKSSPWLLRTRLGRYACRAPASAASRCARSTRS